jgi:hypothetical protein
MTINFCTLPTQHGKLGYFFPKLTAQLVSRNSNYVYVCVCVCVCIYIYIKRLIIACYALIAATTFPGSVVISTEL